MKRKTQRGFRGSFKSFTWKVIRSFPTGLGLISILIHFLYDLPPHFVSRVLIPPAAIRLHYAYAAPALRLHCAYTTPALRPHYARTTPTLHHTTPTQHLSFLFYPLSRLFAKTSARTGFLCRVSTFFRCHRASLSGSAFSAFPASILLF